MPDEFPPNFRGRFLDDPYLGSWVQEGSAAPLPPAGNEPPKRSVGGASTVLAAVHLPTSLWVVGETLSPVPHVEISHIEVAGVAILAVSATLAFVELVRQGVISYRDFIQALDLGGSKAPPKKNGREP